MSYEVLRPKDSLEPEGFLVDAQPTPDLRLVNGVGDYAPAPVAQMSYSEKLERTRSVATTTHTRIAGEVYRVEDLPGQFGFTYEQLFATRLAKLATAMHCVLEGQPVTYEQFQAAHPNIQLGEE